MSELTPSSQDPNAFSPSSGGASLEGYFYQLDVSILTALDLVLAKKVAHEIVLEPTTDEDLEADIENEPSALSETIGPLAEQVMKLLPKKTAYALSRALEGTGKLSGEDLNGLGDVRTTETVKHRLSTLFENTKVK